MILSDLLTTLAYGSISNLAIGGDGSGVIPEAHRPKVIGHINQALLALHTRFVLSEKSLVLRVYDNTMNYPLRQQYADTDPTDTYQKYIQDTVWDPFTDDVIKILRVFDEDGYEHQLNHGEDPDSFYTPQQRVLQIPRPVTGNVYFVHYQAKHPRLNSEDLDQDIDLPSPLEEALEVYVAYKAIGPMNGPEHAAKAVEHLQRYEMLCSEVDQKDLVGSSIMETVPYKFEERGFT